MIHMVVDIEVVMDEIIVLNGAQFQINIILFLLSRILLSTLTFILTQNTARSYLQTA